jgi:hypothetical protein
MKHLVDVAVKIKEGRYIFLKDLALILIRPFRGILLNSSNKYLFFVLTYWTYFSSTGEM